MRRTKQVLVGGVPIGGGAPVAIQSLRLSVVLALKAADDIFFAIAVL